MHFLKGVVRKSKRINNEDENQIVMLEEIKNTALDNSCRKRQAYFMPPKRRHRSA